MNKTAAPKRKANAPEPSWLTQYLTEVCEVLERPSVAIAVFIIGVVLIVAGSREVKWTLELLERFGLAEKPQDTMVVGNFMAVFVFFFIWIDIIVLLYLKRLFLAIGGYLGRYYAKAQNALFSVHQSDQQEDDDDKKKKKRA